MKKKLKIARSAEWKQFEASVESVYKSLGFSTIRDVLVQGRQVDILAEKVVPGVGRIKIAIECKHSSVDDSVSREEITEFRNFVEVAKLKGEITQGVLAYNTECTRFGKEANAGSVSVNLTSLRELEDQLFDLRDAYQAFVSEYEANRIFSSFVEPSGKASFGFQARGCQHIPDVGERIVSLIGEAQISLIGILADFGAGKTTLLERLKYRYAKEYLVESSSRRPILVLLKEYYRYPDLNLLLAHTIRRELARDISPSVFWRAAHDGKFIFLLDGLDEMLAQSDVRSRAEQFMILSRLFHLKSPVVLTCRPAYFITGMEYNDAVAAVLDRYKSVAPGDRKQGVSDDMLASYKNIRRRLDSVFVDQVEIQNIQQSISATIELEPFDDKQIDTFLQKNHDRFKESTAGKCGWKEVREFLDNIYDLSDLMKRPILLDMITQTVFEGVLDVTRRDLKLGPTALYEMYTDLQFDRDWKKGPVRQQFLSRDQRRLFAEAVALSMFLKGNLEVRYEDILEVIDSHPDIMADLRHRLAAATIEHVAADIQLSAFLSRHEDGLFRFTHRSFMEYFVARRLRNLLAKTCREPLFYQRLSNEILYFLGGFGFLDGRVSEILRHLQAKRKKTDPRSQVFNRNISTAIFFTGHEIKELRLFEGDVENVQIRRCRILGSFLRKCKFVKTVFQEFGLGRTNCAEVEFTECRFEATEFKALRGDIYMRGCTGDGVSLSSGDFCLHVEATRLSNVNLTKTALKVQGSVGFDKLTCSDAQLDFDVNNSEIKKSRFSGGHAKMSLTKSKIKDCEFSASILELKSGANLDRCRFLLESELIANYNDTGDLDLAGSVFTQARVIFRSTSSSRHRACEGGGVRFTDSVILGLPIPLFEYTELDQKKQAFHFEKCRGFLLLACPNTEVLRNEELRSGAVLIFRGLPIITSEAFYRSSSARKGLIDAVSDEVRSQLRIYVTELEK